MSDGQQSKPDSGTPQRPPHQPPPGKRGGVPPRRMHYDYSRSVDKNAGNHWYSWPGQSNPLSGQSGRPPAQGAPQRAAHPPLPSRPGGPPPSRKRQRLEERRTRRNEFQQNWAWAIIAIAMLGLTIITSMILIVVLRSGGDDNALASAETPIEPTSIIYSNPDVGEPGTGDGVGGALEGNSLSIQPWDGQDRLTVLVMGMDRRPGERNANCRTDTIMLISLDPVSKSIGILSIPRDTYVEVPNYGLERINTACVLGNLERSGYGPELAMQTVQYNFGIRVNEYVMIDFQAFISIIDRINGVTVNVEREINDPTYPSMDYGYDPFYLPAGEQHLDGETALKYARSRHTSDDVDRQRRQQEIILAVRQKVLQFNMVDDLVQQAPGIWNDLSNGIDTSLELRQIIQLALFAQDVPRQNIHNGIVSWDYLFSYRTPTGGAVLVPRRAALAELMTEVFGEGYNR